MKNMLYRELPQSITVMLHFLKKKKTNYSNINTCVVDEQYMLMILKATLVTESRLQCLCAIFICRDLQTTCYFGIFPCCIVFCIPGSWRSVAYPPQQPMSSGDVC